MAADTEANAQNTTRASQRFAVLHWLGVVRYGEALALQEWLLAERIAGRCGDTILLLEHSPVVTLGRGAKPENLLFSAQQLQARNVDLFETGRGGDVTMHAPGQLVAYPILDLQPERCDVRRYVRDLASVMIELVAAYEITAQLLDEYIGIWVNPSAPARFDAKQPIAKLGAIGVRLSRWVTMHGFALNVHSDPGLDGLIVPCGIVGHEVTSLAALCAQQQRSAPPAVEEFARASAAAFARVFGMQTSYATPAQTADLWAQSRVNAAG